MYALLLSMMLLFTDPTAIVVGPTESPPGELIKLDASTSDADAVEWIAEGHFEKSDDNRKLYYANPQEGTYIFYLIAVKNNDGKPSIKITKHELVIGKPQPPSLSDQVTLILKDNKDDAMVFYGVHSAIADSIRSGKYSKLSEVLEARDSLLVQRNWTKGKYNQLKDVYSKLFKDYTTDHTLSKDELTDLANKFDTLAKGAKNVK